MIATNLKLGLMLGTLLSVAIVTTNVIWPSLVGHPSPDSLVSEGVGWIFVVALVCCAGYLRVRRTSKVGDGAITGGVITFIAFGIAMFTFVIIDNLFLQIVSQQPEKIWLFERSGFPDMRSYLNHANLRAFWTALPVITVFGAICGIIGGYVSRFAQARTP